MRIREFIRFAILLAWPSLFVLPLVVGLVDLEHQISAHVVLCRLNYPKMYTIVVQDAPGPGCINTVLIFPKDTIKYELYEANSFDNSLCDAEGFGAGTYICYIDTAHSFYKYDRGVWVSADSSDVGELFFRKGSYVNHGVSNSLTSGIYSSWRSSSHFPILPSSWAHVIAQRINAFFPNFVPLHYRLKYLLGNFSRVFLLLRISIFVTCVALFFHVYSRLFFTNKYFANISKWIFYAGLITIVVVA